MGADYTVFGDSGECQLADFSGIASKLARSIGFDLDSRAQYSSQALQETSRESSVLLH